MNSIKLYLLMSLALASCKAEINSKKIPNKNPAAEKASIEDELPKSVSLTETYTFGSDCSISQDGTIDLGDSSYISGSAKVTATNISLYSSAVSDLGFVTFLDPLELNEDKSFDLTWSILSDDNSEYSASKSYSLKLSSASKYPLKVPTLNFPGHHGKQPSSQACSGGFETSLMLGWTSGCVLNKDGRLACWGNKAYSYFGTGEHQLGLLDVVGIDGSTGNSSTMIDAGQSSACAIMDDSTVRCWGSGYTNGPSPNTPSTIANFSATSGKTPVSIAMGHRDNVCAVMDDAKLRCWKGDASAPTENTYFDATVAGTQVVEVSVGINHNCALMTDESVKCWGSNSRGQLGRGTVNVPTSDNNPGTVLGIDGTAGQEALQVIAGNYSSCALMKSGTVKCWGFDNYNALGNGDASTDSNAVPTDVNNIDGTAGKKAVSINQAMSSSLCATLDTGALHCWGLNSTGGLGSGNLAPYSEPAPIAAYDASSVEKTISTFEGGWTHSCALHSNNAVSCTGSASKTRTIHIPRSANEPQIISEYDGSSGKKAAQVVVGENMSCIRDINGAVKCFGWVNNLGHGEILRSTGVEYTSKIGNELAAAKQLHTQSEIAACAILKDDSLACWGFNVNGLGFGEDQVIVAKPKIVDFFDGTTDERKVVSVGSGYYYACVLSKKGAVHCWGYNKYYNLGDGTSTYRFDATPVVGLDGSPGNKVVAISSDAPTGNHNCAIMESGALKCWGRGNYGAIGNSLFDHQPSPVDVTGIDGSSPDKTAVAVAKGYRHTCAIMATGAAKCWGSDSSGQLGNGSGITGNQSTPTDVIGIDGTTGKKAVAITTGLYTSCALMENGAVLCWGAGTSGQIGNGDSVNQVEPVQLPAIDGTPGNRALAISMGYNFACAAMENGGVKCWGVTNYNTLGHDSDSPTFENSPVEVLGPAEVSGGSPYVDGAISKLIEAL